MQNGDFHYAEFSNGLTNASAMIAFDGSRANIQSFHGESGGGKVECDGVCGVDPRPVYLPSGGEDA